MNREDREAEKRLGKRRGHFSSKVWTSYGKGVDRRICSECSGICCNALSELVGCLVEKGFLMVCSPAMSFLTLTGIVRRMLMMRMGTLR